MSKRPKLPDECMRPRFRSGLLDRVMTAVERMDDRSDQMDLLFGAVTRVILSAQYDEERTLLVAQMLECINETLMVHYYREALEHPQSALALLEGYDAAIKVS